MYFYNLALYLGERLKKGGEDLAQVVNAGTTEQNIDDDDDND